MNAPPPLRGARALAPLLRRSLAVLIGLGAALALVEGVFRLHPPRLVRLAGEERAYTRHLTEGARARRVLAQDEALGYRPVAGGDEYGTHGARHNGYALEKPPGFRRLVFLGDSVTYRGTLIDALRGRWGDQGREYWNAGVEGYSTAQEAGYYADHLAGLQEDRVVLTFHLNDFETTPLTYRDADGNVRIYFTRRPLGEVSPWLLRRSYLYRFLIGFTIQNVAAHGFEEQVADEVRAALERLRRTADERGAELSVWVLPWMAPAETWPAEIQRRHRRALELLRELEIDHVDLLPALEAALAAGTDVQQQPGDTDHPSPGFARHAVEWLSQAGFSP